MVSSLPNTSVLALGFVLGLKHAIEADHLAAVSTIVSERKTLLSSSLVGGLWGIGHTLSLFIAGVVVIFFRFEISPGTERAIEFCVGLMLVALGANALRKLLKAQSLHLHVHKHGTRAQIHPHLHSNPHEGSVEAHSRDSTHATHAREPHLHRAFRPGARPILIGMVHGLAGSSALMLLVLTTISSPVIGMTYIIIFGLGSIGGMMLMSTLIGLPIYLTAVRFNRANLAVRGLGGLFSLGFGLFTIYQIGFSQILFP